MNLLKLRKTVYELLGLTTEDKDWVITSAINSALMFMQRQRNFKALTELVPAVYVAETIRVDLETLLATKFKTVTNVSSENLPLALVSHETVLKENEVALKGGPCGRSNKCYMVGKHLGLWPVPKEDVDLEITLVSWVSNLELETDTNILTENCWDYITYKAAQIIDRTRPEDQRIYIAKGLIDEAWNSVVVWDETHSGGEFPVEM